MLRYLRQFTDDVSWDPNRWVAANGAEDSEDAGAEEDSDNMHSNAPATADNCTTDSELELDTYLEEALASGVGIGGIGGGQGGLGGGSMAGGLGKWGGLGAAIPSGQKITKSLFAPSAASPAAGEERARGFHGGKRPIKFDDT